MTETWNYGEAAEPTGFPWPPREDQGVLAAFGETWKSSTFSPASFFRRMPKPASAGPAVLYYLIVGVLLAGVSLFWDATGVFTSAAGDRSTAMDVGFGTMDPVIGFLLSPLVLLIALVVTTGLTHLMLLILGAARHGFGTTMRVFCFAYSPSLFGVVPLLGTIVGMVWTVVLSIIGLREAHAIDGWKAAVAVLLPVALLIGFLFFVALMLAAAGMMLLAA